LRTTLVAENPFSTSPKGVSRHRPAKDARCEASCQGSGGLRAIVCNPTTRQVARRRPTPSRCPTRAHFLRAFSACVSSGTAWKRSATRP